LEISVKAQIGFKGWSASGQTTSTGQKYFTSYVCLSSLERFNQIQRRLGKLVEHTTIIVDI